MLFAALARVSDGARRDAFAAWATRYEDRTRLFGVPAGGDRPRIGLVSQDLSASGAPKIVLEIAVHLIAAGHDVLVVSPRDGPFREALVAAGAVVLIDGQALEHGSAACALLADTCRAAICNTVVTAGSVATIAPRIPTTWYLHEVSLLHDLLAGEGGLAATLALPWRVWAGSELTAAIVRPARPDVEVVPYGLEPLVAEGVPSNFGTGRVKLGLFASIEPRKGQDLAVAALARLPAERRNGVELTLFGRVLDAGFAAGVEVAARDLPMVRLAGELDAERYRAAMLACDVVLVPSRADTLPLVSLDALGAGRVLLCTQTVGTSAYLTDGVDGFVAEEPTPEAIARALERLLARRRDWRDIARAGREVFDRTFSRSAFAARLVAAVDAALRDSAGVVQPPEA